MCKHRAATLAPASVLSNGVGPVWAVPSVMISVPWCSFLTGAGPPTPISGQYDVPSTIGNRIAFNRDRDRAPRSVSYFRFPNTTEPFTTAS